MTATAIEGAAWGHLLDLSAPDPTGVLPAVTFAVGSMLTWLCYPLDLRGRERPIGAQGGFVGTLAVHAASFFVPSGFCLYWLTGLLITGLKRGIGQAPIRS